jgi:hypothetical protein
MSGSATEEIGDVVFREVYNEDGSRRCEAVEVPQVTVVGLSFLDAAMTGEFPNCRVERDLLILDLANGTWIYHLTGFNPDHRGINARLIQGEALAE